MWAVFGSLAAPFASSSRERDDGWLACYHAIFWRLVNFHNQITMGFLQSLVGSWALWALWVLLILEGEETGGLGQCSLEQMFPSTYLPSTSCGLPRVLRGIEGFSYVGRSKKSFGGFVRSSFYFLCYLCVRYGWAAVGRLCFTPFSSMWFATI